jgi:hypothetical protein
MMVEGGSVRPLQATARRRGAALAIAAIALAVLAGCAYPASARSECADAILEDWTRGTLRSTFPLDCYDEAIDALPEDLRAYTTAADDISRAAFAATREDRTSRKLTAAPGASGSVRAFPSAVAVFGVLVALVSASGLAASLLRRRRAR